MAILENIDIDKGILQNIDIDKISYQLGFGISNTPSPRPIFIFSGWWRRFALAAGACSRWSRSWGNSAQERLPWHRTGGGQNDYGGDEDKEEIILKEFFLLGIG